MSRVVAGPFKTSDAQKLWALGLDTVEIATRLETTESAIYNRLAKAREPRPSRDLDRDCCCTPMRKSCSAAGCPRAYRLAKGSRP